MLQLKYQQTIRGPGNDLCIGRPTLGWLSGSLTYSRVPDLYLYPRIDRRDFYTVFDNKKKYWNKFDIFFTKRPIKIINYWRSA